VAQQAEAIRLGSVPNEPPPNPDALPTTPPEACSPLSLLPSLCAELEKRARKEAAMQRSSSGAALCCFGVHLIHPSVHPFIRCLFLPQMTEDAIWRSQPRADAGGVVYHSRSSFDYRSLCSRCFVVLGPWTVSSTCVRACVCVCVCDSIPRCGTDGSGVGLASREKDVNFSQKVSSKPPSPPPKGAKGCQRVPKGAFHGRETTFFAFSSPLCLPPPPNPTPVWNRMERSQDPLPAASIYSTYVHIW